MRILLATMQFGRGYSQGTERYVGMLCAGLRDAGHEPIVLAGDPEQRDPPRRLGERIAENPTVLACPTHTWLAVRGEPAEGLAALLHELRPDIVHLTNPGHIGLGALEAAVATGAPAVVTIMDYWWLCPKHTLHHFRRGVCDGEVTWRECVRCIAATHESAALRTAASLPIIGPALLPGLLLARAAGRGVRPDEIDRWKSRRRYIFEQLSRAAAVIYPSRTAASLIGRRLNGPQPFSIPYGLEPHWFQRRPAEGRATHSATPVIGFAGALQPHKGAHLLLAALNRLGWTDVTVRVAGGGSQRYVQRRLVPLVRSLKVEFLGRLPPEQMPDFLRSLDVLVLPSLWPENLPIVMLEAYASGVSVLASDVGGMAELIADRGCLFAPNSVEAMAECLQAWRAGIGLNPMPAPYVSSAAEMCRRTLEVYESVLGD